MNELIRSGFEEQSKFDEFDVLSDLKFINEGKAIRAIQLRKKQPYQIDIDLLDCTCTMKKMEKFEDKTIFKFGLTYS